ncbi:MAG: IS4 family transposase [Planctomycetia bacterium]|nr:IS4 family transposase [Planctomycetia bacterium]
MKPKVSQSEEVGDGRCKGESRCQEYELWELAETGVVLVRGRNDCNYSIWKEMLEEHHYLHAAKLYGQQIKYLVRSSEIGWIGAMSFSSSAWRVRVRDERLGWDEEARKNGLRRVVSNSRFLIVPWLRVKNLASHVMSKALKRLPGDWEEAYKVTPVLVETYVEKGRYEGTCYKASNWEYLGETQGRGRNDRYHQNRLSRKHVFAYELEEGILDAGREEREYKDWVEEELQDVRLPNLAKKKRVMSIARDFFASPASPIPMACNTGAKLKGAYRFFGDEGVNPADILHSHRKQTLKRAEEYNVVLSVNDTTSMNLSTHKATKGLGCLSTEQGEDGYFLHDTVVFTTAGIPLGVLDAQTWARDPKEHGKKAKRKQKPIGEKESYKWLRSLQATAEAMKEASGVDWVSVGDREADIYELFELASQQEVSFLVRSFHNRRVCEDTKVWEVVDREVPVGRMMVFVKGKDKREREAELEIRFREVRIRHPRGEKEEVRLWAIRAKEVSPLKGEEGLDWKLLTNREVRDFEQACEKVQWYTVRFRIEVFHKILKSGRRSEDRRLGSLDRLERCLTIDMITAWRLMYLTMQGRTTPEVASDLFFSEQEIEVLKLIKYRGEYAANKDKSLSLRDAILIIAMLGGFIKGKGREPGVEIMWRGMRRLADILTGVSLTTNVHKPDYG